MKVDMLQSKDAIAIARGATATAAMAEEESKTIDSKTAKVSPSLTVFPAGPALIDSSDLRSGSGRWV